MKDQPDNHLTGAVKTLSSSGMPGVHGMHQISQISQNSSKLHSPACSASWFALGITLQPSPSYRQLTGRKSQVSRCCCSSLDRDPLLRWLFLVQDPPPRFGHVLNCILILNTFQHRNWIMYMYIYIYTTVENHLAPTLSHIKWCQVNIWTLQGPGA